MTSSALIVALPLLAFFLLACYLLVEAVVTTPGTIRRHSFHMGNYLVEEGIPAQYRRREATCSSCGETRLVYHGVALENLNRIACPGRKH